jgi:hypothetical protein
MAFSAAGWAEQQHVGAGLEPDVAGGERHDLGFRERRYCLEVEGGEGLACRQPGFGEVAFEAATATVGDLVLGQGGEELCGRPALLVGLRRELGPDRLDARQAQLGEQQLDAGGVNGHGRRHGATSMSAFAGTVLMLARLLSDSNSSS